MWSSPDKPIPRWQIQDEHLRVLDEFVKSGEEPPNSVEDALKFLQVDCIRPGGFNLFRRGLLEKDAAKCREALRMIRKHMGK
jgi:hypothetical protein